MHLAHIAQVYPPSSDWKPTLQSHPRNLQLLGSSSAFSFHCYFFTCIALLHKYIMIYPSAGPGYSKPEKWQRNAGSRWNINKAQWRKQGSRRCFLFQNHLCVSADTRQQWHSGTGLLLLWPSIFTLLISFIHNCTSYSCPHEAKHFYVFVKLQYLACSFSCFPLLNVLWFWLSGVGKSFKQMMNNYYFELQTQWY